MTIRRLPGPPSGFWSNGPYGTGAWLFFEDPPYGTAVAPTVFTFTPEVVSPMFGTYTAPTTWLPMRPTPSHGPVRGTVFDAGRVGRVACGTRRSVAATAVGPSVVPV